MRSRKNATLKNFINSICISGINILLNIVLRAVFVRTLGTEYLGVNGLFSNVLGFLSLAELGIGTAISFNLYKPLADNDISKIQALMNFYRTAYRVVAIVVLVISVALIPFLPYIAKGSEKVENLTFIYCIYIFNTVSTYLITYKSTIITADQNMYKLSRINFFANFIIIVFQIIELFVLKDYIFYLIISSFVGLIRNFYINYYTNKNYPYLKLRNHNRLTNEERSTIFMKLRAMMYHNIGGVVIFQTDSIITSSMININAVGLVENYNMIINIIKSFTNTFFGSMNASYGNLLATTNKEYQLKIFDRINFICYWISSFTSICLFFLIDRFISIWLNSSNYILNKTTVFLLVINYYILMMRTPVSIPKKAAGLYEQDKLSPVFESIINLSVSIIGAKFLGIAGVYLGTLLSSFIPMIWAPMIIYKCIFNKSSVIYFKQYFFRLMIMFLSGSIVFIIVSTVQISNKYFSFIFALLICLLIPNLLIFVVYRNNENFIYTITLTKNYITMLKNQLTKRTS